MITMDPTNIFLFILTIAVAGWLFYRTHKDYQKAISGDKYATNPRSFFWKAAIFIIVAIFLLKPQDGKIEIIPIIICIILFLLGIWNLIYAVKYLKYKKSTK